MQALTFQQITHPEDLAKCLDNVRRLREGGLRDFAMEKRYIHKNGSRVWVNITVSPMWQPSDKPASHIVGVEDINERKKAEAALAQIRGNLEQMVEQRTARLNHMVQRLRWAVKVRREVERQIKEAEFRYRTVADFAYDWEYWKTPDGLLFYCSPSCERITGYTPSEMSTNPGLIAQLVHPQDKEN